LVAAYGLQGLATAHGLQGLAAAHGLQGFLAAQGKHAATSQAGNSDGGMTPARAPKITAPAPTATTTAVVVSSFIFPDSISFPLFPVCPGRSANRTCRRSSREFLNIG